LRMMEIRFLYDDIGSEPPPPQAGEGTPMPALKASRKPIKLRGLAWGPAPCPPLFNSNPCDIKPIRICH
jgi:hypothetical protein